MKAGEQEEKAYDHTRLCIIAKRHRAAHRCADKNRHRLPAVTELVA